MNRFKINIVYIMLSICRRLNIVVIHVYIYGNQHLFCWIISIINSIKVCRFPYDEQCTPCCDFRIKTMIGSSLHRVVCRRVHVLFTLYVFAQGGVQHILCCVFVVLFFVVLCTLCCQLLCVAPSVFFLDRFECVYTIILHNRLSCQISQ